LKEKILVPLDGSGAAEAVIPYVAAIAGPLGAKVTLVSVALPHLSGMDHLHKGYLDHVAGHLREHMSGSDATIETELLRGKPDEEILRFAGQQDSDLIIVSSLAPRSHQPRLLGKIAMKILWQSGKPVLVVRAPVSDVGIVRKGLVRRILVPLDGSITGEAAVGPALLLAKALGAEVVLFEVVEPYKVLPGMDAGAQLIIPHEGEAQLFIKSYLDVVAERFKAEKVPTETVLGKGLVADQIVDFAQANRIDLIAMSAHGASGIGRWMFGSVAEKLLQVGSIPLVVARPRA
jgi:nucleotide-binding universal stress UspA family protein